MSKRWRIIIGRDQASGLPERVVNSRDAERVIDLVRSELRRLCKGPGCGSFYVGVHVEGPDCDHETGGA